MKRYVLLALCAVTISQLFNAQTSIPHSQKEDTKGYMSDTYEDIAFSLGKNQISGVIEDNGGFYIIKRFELDNLYVMMNFDTLSDRYQQYTFIEMIDDTQKELEFIPNDYLNSISMLDIE